MKTKSGILAIVIGGMVFVSGAGCHKNTEATEAPKTLEDGVAALRVSVATASPEVQSNYYNGVSYGIRYHDYARASAALQQIASDPSLTDQQKKLVSDVTDLLKQKIDSGQNATPPAH